MSQPKLSTQAITNSTGNEELPRHRWYPIKEGFSAKLISDSITEFQKNNRKSFLAIEPFSGSGTAPVECARLGIDCLAFEVNPFLAFVGQAKLKQTDAGRFSTRRDVIIKGLKTPHQTPLEKYSTFCEGNGKHQWLFNRSVLRSFVGGWKATKDCTPAERALFRLALIRAAMDNCNAYPDGKCLRYKRLDNYNCFNARSVMAQFDKYVTMMKEDIEALPLREKLSRVEQMDARRLSNYWDKTKFDICITSPPYLNSFDYSDVYRPELFLGGFVNDNDQLMKIRLKTIRSHVQASWAPPIRNGYGAVYSKMIEKIKAKKDELWSVHIPEMIQAYFEDMENLLKSLKSKANRGAMLKIAVGTSAYAGVVVPVDLIIADIAENVGWLLKEVQVVRRLRSSGQLWKHEDQDKTVPKLRESIVILRSGI
jgi:DNA modification methylase